ncbi:FG-GAP-like repeat-containing protein [Streptomyces sp. NPDC012769]|uniref:endonuclease/exonuclease/phosphatase family protein n=1 Tax=Streptomyces sp. NPDC012769 TaxID=3364848 RepID=UPI0036877057
MRGIRGARSGGTGRGRARGRGGAAGRSVIGLALVAGVMAGSGAQPVAADPVVPQAVRTVSYNACGAHTCQNTVDSADEWAAKFRSRMDAEGGGPADVIALQELCAGQYEALRKVLVGYTSVRVGEQEPTGCGRWGGTSAKFGQAVFVKGAAADFSSHQGLVNPGEADPAAQRWVLCVKGPIGGRTTLACGTHLATNLPSNGTPVLLDHMERWAAGAPALVTGDFNAVPSHSALRPVRAGLCATGPLVEADAGANRPTAWASAPPHAYRLKYDHAFFGSRDFTGLRAGTADIDLTPGEDHKLLWAEAQPLERAPARVPGDLTGDLCPDMLAVRKDDTLRLYPGTGRGGFGSPRVIGSGPEWNGAVVSHRGDWDGDGDQDVVARKGDQLLLHRNTGGGDLEAGVVMKVSETGWAHTTPVAAGDVDGDGGPDLVARSSTGLWLHRGRVAADGGWLSYGAVRIGTEEWKDQEVLVPGDVTGDAKAELWARDAAGNIKQYGYDSTAKALGSPAALGTLPTGSRLLGLSAGDGDGDGLSDLWYTTSSADLAFHPGGAAFSEGDSVTVGTGGWGYFSHLG